MRLARAIAVSILCPHIVGTQSIRKTSLAEPSTVSLNTIDPVQSACDEADGHVTG